MEWNRGLHRGLHRGLSRGCSGILLSDGEPKELSSKEEMESIIYIYILSERLRRCRA